MLNIFRLYNSECVHRGFWSANTAATIKPAPSSHWVSGSRWRLVKYRRLSKEKSIFKTFLKREWSSVQDTRFHINFFSNKNSARTWHKKRTEAFTRLVYLTLSQLFLFCTTHSKYNTIYIPFSLLVFRELFFQHIHIVSLGICVRRTRNHSCIMLRCVSISCFTSFTNISR